MRATSPSTRDKGIVVVVIFVFVSDNETAARPYPLPW
jgi:hypothetical protein